MPVSSPKQRAVNLLKFSRTMLLGVMKDWPADKVTFQNCPADNHLLWTLGHLCTGYAWFGGLLGADIPRLPDNYNTLFGFGSKPSPDAAAYPPLADVRAVFQATFDAFIAGAEKLSESDLLGPPSGDTGGFAADKLDLIERAAWHEGWHAGQLSTLRRCLGLPSTMG